MRTLIHTISTIALIGAILFGFYLALPAAITETIETGVSIGEWMQNHNI